MRWQWNCSAYVRSGIQLGGGHTQRVVREASDRWHMSRLKHMCIYNSVHGPVKHSNNIFLYFLYTHLVHIVLKHSFLT